MKGIPAEQREVAYRTASVSTNKLLVQGHLPCTMLGCCLACIILRAQPWRRKIIYALDCSAATTTVRHRGRKTMWFVLSCFMRSNWNSRGCQEGKCRRMWLCFFYRNKSDRAVRPLWLTATPPGSNNCGLFLHQPAFISPLYTVHNQAPSPWKLSAEKHEKYQIQPLSKQINHKNYLFEIS